MFETDKVCPSCGKGKLFDLYNITLICEFHAEMINKPLLKDGNGIAVFCTYKEQRG